MAFEAGRKFRKGSVLDARYRSWALWIVFERDEKLNAHSTLLWASFTEAGSVLAADFGAAGLRGRYASFFLGAGS